MTSIDSLREEALDNYPGAIPRPIDLLVEDKGSPFDNGRTIVVKSQAEVLKEKFEVLRTRDKKSLLVSDLVQAFNSSKPETTNIRRPHYNQLNTTNSSTTKLSVAPRFNRGLASMNKVTIDNSENAIVPSGLPKIHNMESQHSLGDVEERFLTLAPISTGLANGVVFQQASTLGHKSRKHDDTKTKLMGERSEYEEPCRLKDLMTLGELYNDYSKMFTTIIDTLSPMERFWNAHFLLGSPVFQRAEPNSKRSCSLELNMASRALKRGGLEILLSLLIGAVAEYNKKVLYIKESWPNLEQFKWKIKVNRINFELAQDSRLDKDNGSKFPHWIKLMRDEDKNHLVTISLPANKVVDRMNDIVKKKFKEAALLIREMEPVTRQKDLNDIYIWQQEKIHLESLMGNIMGPFDVIELDRPSSPLVQSEYRTSFARFEELKEACMDSKRSRAAFQNALAKSDVHSVSHIVIAQQLSREYPLFVVKKESINKRLGLQSSYKWAVGRINDIYFPVFTPSDVIFNDKKAALYMDDKQRNNFVVYVQELMDHHIAKTEEVSILDIKPLIKYTETLASFRRIMVKHDYNREFFARVPGAGTTSVSVQLPLIIKEPSGLYLPDPDKEYDMTYSFSCNAFLSGVLQGCCAEVELSDVLEADGKSRAPVKSRKQRRIIPKLVDLSDAFDRPILNRYWGNVIRFSSANRDGEVPPSNSDANRNSARFR